MNSQAESQLERTNKLLLEQVVLCPIRSKNIPELCFTNNCAFIYNIKVTPTLLSDHKLIELADIDIKLNQLIITTESVCTDMLERGQNTGIT